METVTTSSTPSCAVARQDAKVVANLIAAFALAGFAVLRLESGGFTVNRWNLSKYCRDLDDLKAFAKQTGARI